MKAAKVIIKTILWIAVTLILLPIALLLMLYSPMVQEIAIDAAIKGLNNPPHRQVNIESARLTFPLSLSVRGLSVVENGDTAIGTHSAEVSIKLLPLIDKKIKVESAMLNGATIKLGTPDSSLYLKANGIDIELNSAVVSLDKAKIELDKANLKRGKMWLAISNDTTATPTDTTQSTPWRMNANLIELNNVDYGMTMMPSIDSLHINLPHAALRNGTVDLGKRTVNVGGLSIEQVNARYLLPSATDIAKHDTQPKPEPLPSPNNGAWTVTADSLRVHNSEVTYATTGLTPLDGVIDFNYLQASKIDIAVDSFYNRGTEIRVPIRLLSAQERSGLRVKASGEFSMDSLKMIANGVNINTNVSSLRFDAQMGMGDPAVNPNLPISIAGNATIGFDDLKIIYPAAKPWLALLPSDNRAIVRINAKGSMEKLQVKELSAQLPAHAKIDLNGSIANLLNFNKANGTLNINGDINDINFIKPSLLDKATAETLNFPPMKLNGNVNISNGTYNGTITATSGNGDLALDGSWNGNAETCKADLTLNSFPIHSFLPNIGLGNASGSIKADINGLDIFKSSTKIDTDIDIKSITYQGEVYRDLKAMASLSGGNADIGIVSYNPAADFQLTADGNLAGDTLRWNFDGEIHNLDLLAMKLSTTSAHGSVSLRGDAVISSDFNHIDSRMCISEIDWHSKDFDLTENNISINFLSNQSQTSIQLDNRDLQANFNSPMHLENFLAHISRTSEFIDKTLGEMWIDAIQLQQALPTFELTVDAGSDNILTNYLGGSDIGFKSLALNASNDSLIALDITSTGLSSGTTLIDDAAINITQIEEKLFYNAKIDNNPGTLDEWAHIAAGGYLSGNKVRAFLHQQNIEDETGYRLGAEVELNDSSLNVTINPYDPVIAYKRWSVNSDNYLRANLNKKHFDANVDMRGNGSAIRLFTNHNEDAHEQEDVVLQVENLHLADWIPSDLLESPIGGDLNANVNFGWGNNEINGGGTVGLKNLLYDKQKVGSFDFDVDVTTNRSGMIRAEASLLVDSIKTITAVGNLNDSTKSNPLNLDFSMIRFPLHVVNPFMPRGTAKLSGMLNGKMDISGTLANPMFNGYIDFDTTAVKISMLGSTLNFAKTPVAVKDNVVKFENFKITGINNNALTMNGTVDLRSLSNASLDLNLNAQNMQIVGSERSRGADVYGKAFVDLNATARGNLRFLDIDASLAMLPGTNVTYVLSDAQTSLSSSTNEEMVKWVNFADTSAVAIADTIATSSMLMDIDATLEIKQGAILNVDISPDGKNKMQVQGSGLFTYSQSIMDDARFIGRYNIDKGFVRYTPPMMSEKHFDFELGSYIAFNGDILNPILNIHAIDEVKANVTSEGQNSRRITFDVGVSATNTLSNMNVVFDLSTDEDITVQNELQSMSPEQRANQAMNILLYGMYTGAGSKGDANGNYLYSFLESRLNSWVSNNIKWVDLSFGIDQYDQTTDGSSQTTTSYSYKLSKTLFNDRFKVSIGGNYSTNTDADENLSQNIINDISVEYYLNKSGSMSVRLFRHVGYESILEGEVTQTGVGFVYRRKIRRIGDMFRWFPSRKKNQSQPSAVITPIKESFNETK